MVNDEILKLTHQVIRRCDNHGLNDILHCVMFSLNESRSNILHPIAVEVKEVILSNFGDLEPNTEFLIRLNDKGRALKSLQLGS